MVFCFLKNSFLGELLIDISITKFSKKFFFSLNDSSNNLFFALGRILKAINCNYEKSLSRLVNYYYEKAVVLFLILHKGVQVIRKTR